MTKSISKNALFKGSLNLFNIVLPILVGPVIIKFCIHKEKSEF
ncbi:Uncharacterised protein [Clostridioides difficile]|nr:Uncharacterised protein [Clostridioides difficile]